MATVLNTIYPPQIETFMPSFCYNESAKIWFNISSYNEDIISKIKFIHISMVDQYDNATVFAGINSGETVYPQYYPLAFDINSNKVGYDLSKKMYWAIVPPQILKTSPYYNVGQYYKVQIRFDLTGSGGYNAYSADYDNPTDFFYWNSNSSKETNALGLALYTNYNQDNFSEWSRGALIKPILIPELTIQNFTSSLININPSTDTPIVGNLIFNKASGDIINRDEDEQLSWYQIKIYSNNKKIEYFSSDKIYSKNNEIKYRLNTSFLTINTQYKIQIIYETKNGYTTSKTYSIKIIEYSTVDNNIQCSKSIDEENGTVTLNITWPNLSDTSGYIIVRRASHKTDFLKWELLVAKKISNLSKLKVIDNTLESLTGYRYQIQYVLEAEMYPPIYIENNDIIHCDFYGNLFSDNEKTLKISFNFQLTNQTNATNRTKIDTLGGHYPFFVQNPNLKYHTYSINGRISSEDDGELFLPKQEVFGEEYYQYRYNSTSPLPHNSECQSIKQNNDWLYEREYRNAVEEWLNNGKPKLFRSMTEGNLIVLLDGVSMTPDTVLGRRLYDFSATMYEIGDGKNLSSISSFGIYDVIDER